MIAHLELLLDNEGFLRLLDETVPGNNGVSVGKSTSGEQTIQVYLPHKVENLPPSLTYRGNVITLTYEVIGDIRPQLMTDYEALKSLKDLDFFMFIRNAIPSVFSAAVTKLENGKAAIRLGVTKDPAKLKAPAEIEYKGHLLPLTYYWGDMPQQH